MPPNGLDQRQWRSVMEGLVLGEYSLLLGAGASSGSRNSRGDELPIGRQLASILSKKYRIPDAGSNGSLRQIYDLAAMVAGAEKLEMPATFVRRLFSDCTVPAWYENLVKVPWEIIWNLNIDDVLEKAYKQAHAGPAVQRFQGASWDSKHIFHREPSSQVTGVHLHGRARHGDLVFGSTEYLGAVAKGGAGHRLFWDSWGTKPVIVLGATLADEIDMAAPLSEAAFRDEQQRPSLVVLPEPSDFDAFRLRQVGLLPIARDADGFFKSVQEDWLAASAAIDDSARSAAEGINPNRVYFHRQFRAPRHKADRHHDFFAGQEPQYEDILQDRDARRDLNVSADKSLDVFVPGRLSVVAFCGSLSGSTTSELRFIRDCELQGLKCFEYDGDAAFDDRALVWIAQREHFLLLRINELYDYVDALFKLSERSSEASATVRIVTSVRPDRVRALEEAVGESLKIVQVPDRLKDDEIRRLIRTLHDQHRLNDLGELQTPDQFRFFAVDHRRDLIDGLGAVSQGRGFADRVAAEYDQVPAAFLDVADIVLLSSELGYPFPQNVVARALGRSTDEVVGAVDDGPLSHLAIAERGLLRSRYRGLASRLFHQRVVGDRRFEASQRLASALAPYISREAISARTRATRIVGQLMDAERIYGWFGRSLTDKWYVCLYDDYSWNSRYWEQRALAECADSQPRYEMAESWAHEAVGCHRDSYSLNTLGTVLLRRALSSGAVDMDLFFVALERVSEAKTLLERPSEHPYVTALSYIRRGYRLSGKQRDVGIRLRRAFNQWSEDARRSLAWQSSPHARRSLERQINDSLKESVATLHSVK